MKRRAGWPARREKERERERDEELAEDLRCVSRNPGIPWRVSGPRIRGAHRYVYGTSGNGQVSIKTREGSKVIKLRRKSLTPFAHFRSLPRPSRPTDGCAHQWILDRTGSSSSFRFPTTFSPMRSRTVLSILASLLLHFFIVFFPPLHLPLRFRSISFHGSPLDNPARSSPFPVREATPLDGQVTHNAYVFIRAIPYSPVTVTRRTGASLSDSWPMQPY